MSERLHSLPPQWGAADAEIKVPIRDFALDVPNAGCRAGIPQWGIADAEIKVPSIENPESKGSPFKAWSGLV